MANENVISNYAPDEFTIILSKGDFVHKIVGFADGTFVSMNRIVPTSTPYQGVGSSSFARVKRRVTAMDVTVTLHQGSPSNTVLQQLQIADANTAGNEWVFACTIKDLSGQTVASSNSAIIAAPANADFSSEFGTRDWSIYLYGSDLFIGGNTPLAPDEVTAVESLGGFVEDKWRLNP
jgi:hypothetical protein